MSTQQDSLNVLSDIAKLEDDWNGYGAKPIPSTVIEFARKIILTLDDQHQPRIYPTARQTIQFEYENDERSYLEFEIWGTRINVLEVPGRVYKAAIEYGMPIEMYKNISTIVSKFLRSV